MKHLAKYFKGYVGVAILGPILKLVEAILELAVPLIVAQMVDKVTKGQTEFHYELLALVLFAVCGISVALLAQYFSARAALGYTQQLTQAVYNHVSKLSALQRYQLGTDSLITRLTNDTYQIQTGLNIFFRLFLRSPFVVIGAIAMAWSLNAEMTLSILGMVLLVYAILIVVIRATSKGYRAIRATTDQLVGTTREMVQGNRVIRSFNQTERALNEYAQVGSEWTTQQFKVGQLSALTNPVTYLLINGALVLILWQGQQLVGMDNVTKGTIVALVNYLTLILNELVKSMVVLTNLNKAWISAKRLEKVLQTPILDTQIISMASANNKDLHVEQLTFTYSHAATPALQQVSFELSAGQWLGITGVTGGGKSTLLQLLVGILPLQQGQVQGMETNQVAWVAQKAQLFQGTVRSNLLLACPTASEQALWHVLDIAQATEFVKQKNGGLDAVVEPFGRNFSGGQRQRLTIARALLMTKAWLLLDDATSALDYETEVKVLQAIRRHFPQTSVLMVSQRLNALQFADQLLVLEQGQVTGQGSLAQVHQSNAYYQALYQSQSLPAEEVCHEI